MKFLPINILLVLLFNLSAMNVRSQRITNDQIFYRMGVPSDYEIFLYYSGNYFAGNRIAEVYFLNNDSTINLSFPEDTIFYGFRKDGIFQYERSANIMSCPPPCLPEFLGYDTLWTDAACKIPYDCDCTDKSYYDSIWCDPVNKIRFNRSFLNFYQWVFFNTADLPRETFIVHLMPDGSLSYRIRYFYNRQNKIIKIGYEWAFPHKLLDLDKPDLYDGHSFSLAGEKYFNYDKSGNIISVISYFINDSSGKKQLYQKTLFNYRNKLLKTIDYTNYVNRDMSYSERAYYLFYKK